MVLPRVHAAVHLDGLHADAARLGRLSGNVLILALGLVFLRQLLEFRDPFVPWREDAALLLGGTPWGTTFLVAMGAAVVLTVALRLTRAGWRAGWVVAAPAGLFMAAFPGLTGHASAGEGVFGALLLTADVLHVLAACAWMGGLAGVLFLGRRGGAASLGADPLPGLVQAFSPVAVASVTILALTGVFASWAHVPSVGALLEDPYGRRLLLKLGFVAVVLGLGWLNWKRLTPRLGDPGGTASLRRAALVELCVGQVVLIVTAVLVRTPPPG